MTAPTLSPPRPSTIARSTVNSVDLACALQEGSLTRLDISVFMMIVCQAEPDDEVTGLSMRVIARCVHANPESVKKSLRRLESVGALRRIPSPGFASIVVRQW